ncbi:hypothetical protein NRO40_29755 [Streptomyces changanensis]|uniref:Uncharacterized protein n=1 Tax=Streptomyces changanensis TaxID=2964669 RepID=A0ABY5NF01_9ACTN|nr:hypothetical protein [Streptomyces kanasensis]UUS34593.1 hypothetical protein NRO40_29755 [Streptomyces changanensis]
MQILYDGPDRGEDRLVRGLLGAVQGAPGRLVARVQAADPARGGHLPVDPLQLGADETGAVGGELFEAVGHGVAEDVEEDVLVGPPQAPLGATCGRVERRQLAAHRPGGLPGELTWEEFTAACSARRPNITSTRPLELMPRSGGRLFLPSPYVELLGRWRGREPGAGPGQPGGRRRWTGPGGNRASKRPAPVRAA